MGKESSSEEETCGVGSSVVGKTSLKTVSSELLGVSLAEDSITLDGGIDDLSDDLLVGSSNAESVLL